MLERNRVSVRGWPGLGLPVLSSLRHLVATVPDLAWALFISFRDADCCLDFRSQVGNDFVPFRELPFQNCALVPCVAHLLFKRAYLSVSRTWRHLNNFDRTAFPDLKRIDPQSNREQHTGSE